MSSLEINKIVGAIVATALCIVVIGAIGNALVHPDEHAAPAAVAVAAKEPAPKVAAAAAAIESLAVLLASADVAKGKKLFKRCAACHTTNSGGKNKIGPNLWNVVNSERGKRAGFGWTCHRPREGSSVKGWRPPSRRAIPTRSRPFSSIVVVLVLVEAVPMVILTSSAVRSPMSMLYLRLT